METSKKIGERLLEKGLITEEQLAAALEEQKRGKHRLLSSILVERGWVTSDRLLEILAEHYSMPFVRLEETRIDPQAIAKVPLKVALHYQVMPVKLDGSTLQIAISDPQDVRLLDELRLALQERYNLNPVLATKEDVLQAIKAHYGVGAETVSRIMTDRGAAAPLDGMMVEAIEDIAEMARDASVVKLVNQLILDAHNRRATDIHLEPHRGRMKLRYRIDGILHNVDLPLGLHHLYPAIISRVKILSNLNIVERRLPQDGRASVKVGKEKLDLRISVLPTSSSGESVVIRILPNEMLLDLKGLGFREQDLKVLEAIIRKPHGLVFVTGPTGSGKTTTLYACLKTIHTEDRKIITIEDPVEYEMEGILQIQVNPPIGLTFAQGLRSMLRHDPNVMMVGEVRDIETAELAIRIALTGHMILSTLHTNDATAGITRLVDMGIDPYLIVSSVECIIAQRLVRLLCPSCREPVAHPLGGKKAYKSRGCKTCNQTGFLGRTAIYEFFVMENSIRELVLQRASSDAIRRTAVELGMQTMREDGLGKVEAGLTTLDEVLRFTQDER